MRLLAQKVKRIMLIVLSILLAGIFILAGLLLAWSPGSPEPFLDENGNPLTGSISEKILSTLMASNRECSSRVRM